MVPKEIFAGKRTGGLAFGIAFVSGMNFYSALNFFPIIYEELFELPWPSELKPSLPRMVLPSVLYSSMVPFPCRLLVQAHSMSDSSLSRIAVGQLVYPQLDNQEAIL
jgi:hypothetical protein